MKSLLLQDEFGQVLPAHSISAGLDYPGVGPQHAFLHETGRARYESVTDAEALDALLLLTRLEGIIPAMESAHAVAFARRYVPGTDPGDLIVINLSGRGEKDVERVARIVREERS
jgi:tryptophan synthase beta chain